MDVQLEVLERSVWSERVAQKHDFEATYNSRTYPPDPDQRNWYTCTGPFNYSEYCNEEVDKLLQEGATATTQEGRQKAYYAYQAITVEDPPVLPLAYPVNIIAYNSKIQDVPELHYRDMLLYVPQMWFSE
jgi:peptide/nickel transport system substrate-binding protein